MQQNDKKNTRTERLISTKTINHTSLSQKTDAVELKENLVVIPHHLFGNH